MATNQAQAVSQLVEQKTGIAIEVPAEDPADLELKALMAKDDEVSALIDEWIYDFKDRGKDDTITEAVLNQKIRQKLEELENAYKEFIRRHSKHASGRLAYGSFLRDLGRDHEAKEQYEKATELAPNDPAAWNNLATVQTHAGSIKNAFSYYEKALALNPNESVYYQNFGTTVYLYRKDAKEYWNIDEQQVFDKALALYDKALELDPTNFELATDYAQSYYGIRPTRYEDAMKAWGKALAIAREELERQGVYIHMARFEINAGKFDVARELLSKVSEEMYGVLKERVSSTLVRKEREAKGLPPLEEE